METQNSTNNHPSLLDLRGHFRLDSWHVTPEPRVSGPLVTVFPITDVYAIIVTSQHTALIDRSSRKLLWTITCPATEAALDLERDQLALARHGWVYVWDLQSGVLTHTLDLDVDLPTGLQFHPQGSLLAVALYADVVQLWQLADGQLLQTLSPMDGGYTSYKSLAFHPDGQLLATGNFEEGAIWLWHVLNGELVQRIELRPQGGRVNGLAFRQDGQLLACGEDELFMQLWNIHNGTVLELPANLCKPVFSPDGVFLVAVGEAGNISRRSFTLWDVATRREIKHFVGHEKRILHLAFSPGGHVLVSCSEDQTVRWWEIESGREIDCVRELFEFR